MKRVTGSGAVGLRLEVPRGPDQRDRPPSRRARLVQHGARERGAAGAAGLRSALRTPRRIGSGRILQDDPRLADVAKPPLHVPIETTREQATHVRGVSAGSAVQSTSCRSTAASVSDVSSPLEGAPARQHLVQHRAKRPDVGAPIDGPALGLLGRHVRGGAENHAHLRAVRGERRRVRLIRVRARDADTSALARPKSSTFTVPSALTLMLAGLRSRWTMPCSCAASSASAICRAIGSASASGSGPSRQPIGQRRALRSAPAPGACDVAVFEAVDVADVRMIERREQLRFAPEPRQPIGVGGERRRAGP